MHLQPLFTSVACAGGGVADELYALGVCLPSGSAVDDAGVDRVVFAIWSLVECG